VTFASLVQVKTSMAISHSTAINSYTDPLPELSCCLWQNYNHDYLPNFYAHYER